MSREPKGATEKAGNHLSLCFALPWVILSTQRKGREWGGEVTAMRIITQAKLGVHKLFSNSEIIL